MSNKLHDLTILHLQNHAPKDASIKELARLYFETYEIMKLEIESLNKELGSRGVYFPNQK